MKETIKEVYINVVYSSVNLASKKFRCQIDYNVNRAAKSTWVSIEIDNCRENGLDDTNELLLRPNSSPLWGCWKRKPQNRTLETWLKQSVRYKCNTCMCRIHGYTGRHCWWYTIHNPAKSTEGLTSSWLICATLAGRIGISNLLTSLVSCILYLGIVSHRCDAEVIAPFVLCCQFRCHQKNLFAEALLMTLANPSLSFPFVLASFLWTTVPVLCARLLSFAFTRLSSFAATAGSETHLSCYSILSILRRRSVVKLMLKIGSVKRTNCRHKRLQVSIFWCYMGGGTTATWLIVTDRAGCCLELKHYSVL